MARSRNIKPSIMDNEELAELDPSARLLFIYLWMLADRDGRLEDRPKRIAAMAFPYDRGLDVNKMLDDLANSGFLLRYTVGNLACIQILSFSKHQSPHVREAKSELPSMDQGTAKVVSEHGLGCDEALPRSPDSLIPSSLIPSSLNVCQGTQGTPGGDIHENPVTKAGAVCIALRSEGISSASPSHPKLIALIKAGAEIANFVDAARAHKGDPQRFNFSYVLGVVKGQMAEQSQMANQARASPDRGKAYETPYQRAARERVAEFAPALAKRAPGAETPPVTIIDGGQNVTAIGGR